METDEGTASNAPNIIKHDIRNELSAITLCLEQLVFEVGEQSEDFQFYYQTITSSCKTINKLLDNI